MSGFVGEVLRSSRNTLEHSLKFAVRKITTSRFYCLLVVSTIVTTWTKHFIRIAILENKSCFHFAEAADKYLVRHSF